jgi:aryl-alcohol dehydrogenase-like predicted oxidoreductase
VISTISAGERGEASAAARLRAISGRAASVIGFGCSRLGSITNTDGPDAAARVIATALDLGVTLFDTADIYGQGDSERLVGAALRARRTEIVLASKGGLRFSALGRAAAAIKPSLRLAARIVPSLGPAMLQARAAQISEDFSTRRLADALEASLRRLSTDYLDIYYLHSPPEAVIRRAEAADLLERCRREGKLRHIGIAVDDAEAAIAALSWPGISIIQAPLGPARAAEFAEFLGLAARRGVAVIARELLHGGALLAGAADTQSVLEHAIAGALRYPATVAAVIGTTRPAHLSAAVRAADRL